MDNVGTDGGGNKGVRGYVQGSRRSGECDGETEDITVAPRRHEEMFTKKKTTTKNSLARPDRQQTR